MNSADFNTRDYFTSGDFHSHFMQNKMYMISPLIGTAFLCRFFLLKLFSCMGHFITKCSRLLLAALLDHKLGREPAQSSRVGVDNPVNSRIYRETYARENCPQIIFGYFTAKIWKNLLCLVTLMISKQKNSDSPKDYELLKKL